MEIEQLLEELNEGTYNLFARLESNSEFLSDKQYAFMANVLYEQYKKAYDTLNIEHNIEHKTKMYQYKQILKLQVPWQFWIFKNKIARVITAEIKEDFIAQFNQRYAQLESEQAKACRKQAAQEEKAAKQEKKEAKATQRRLKKDAKKRKKNPKKKDRQSK